jgi:hypothetical protein
MSDLSVFLPLVVLQAFPGNIPVETAAHYRYMQAVAMIESAGNKNAIGDGGRARGAWQMHRAAWVDAQAWQRARGARPWAWSDWQHPQAQTEMAFAYLKVCSRRLEGARVKVDPVNLYLCYAMGFAAFEKAGFDRAAVPGEKLNAAERVEAIFIHGR